MIVLHQNVFHFLCVLLYNKPIRTVDVNNLLFHLHEKNNCFGTATITCAVNERILSTVNVNKFDSHDAKYPLAYSFHVLGVICKSKKVKKINKRIIFEYTYLFLLRLYR